MPTLIHIHALSLRVAQLAQHRSEIRILCIVSASDMSRRNTNLHAVSDDIQKPELIASESGRGDRHAAR